MPDTEVAYAAADAEQKDISENVSLIVAVQTKRACYRHAVIGS